MRPRSFLLTAALVTAAAACGGDDDADDTATTPPEPTAPVTVAPTVPTPTTAPPTTAPPTTAAPTTTPTSVITDTEAVGGSSLSTVDLTTGAATRLGNVGGPGNEIGVLGLAVAGDGTLHALTDVPTLLVVDRAAPDAAGSPTPVDADGDTLLALARRATDDALFAVGATGGVFRVDPASGTTTLVAEIAVDDPGVGLHAGADGTLEIVIGTGSRLAVDPDTGAVTDLPALSADEAPPRIVAIAHDGTTRYGIDAAVDELVTIADDGTIDTVGPLGLDVTDGASLDIGPDGMAILANPG